MQRLVLSLLAGASALFLVPSFRADAEDRVPAGESGELHGAPAAEADPKAPIEAQLSPPPDSEKEPVEPGLPIAASIPAGPKAPAAGLRFTEADLEPYFAHGKLLEARAAFEEGQYERARGLLADQGQRPPIRYLRALAALRSGDAPFAADEMARLAGARGGRVLYPALRERCLLHAALASEELERWTDAAGFYAQITEGSRLFVDARLGASRSLHRVEDLAGAVTALEPLARMPPPSWGRDVAAEALIALADLHQEREDAAAERAALGLLWSTHPLSPLARQAEARVPDFTLEERVIRAEALVDAHRNADGIALLESSLADLELPGDLACRARFVLGKGLRKQRAHTRAIEVLAPVVERCEQPDLRVRALYVLASSRSIADPGHGPGTYEQLAAEFPRHSFADDALYYAAALHLRAEDETSALRLLDTLGQSYPEGDFLAEGLFKAFWIRRKQGRLEEALAVLERIETLFRDADESYELERAAYWRARVLAEQAQPEAAAGLLERLSLSHPATYYGLMARSQLAVLDPARMESLLGQIRAPSASANPWPLLAGPLESEPRFLAGVELLRLGFSEAASSELMAVPRGELPAEALRLLVHALTASGNPRGAHAVARTSLRRELGGRLTEHTRAIWEAAYPSAYRGLVVRHSSAAKVDPDLLQALMREESALDPQALSWAGALGLTQLMPATAGSVARSLGLGRVTTRQLLEPELNIRLGATYLGRLLRQFGANAAYALAGYNAGGGAVRGWQSRSPELTLDEWVEEIPISETRGYVKRVLRSYNTYQLLYAKEPPLVVSTGR